MAQVDQRAGLLVDSPRQYLFQPQRFAPVWLWLWSFSFLKFKKPLPEQVRKGLCFSLSLLNRCEQFVDFVRCQVEVKRGGKERLTCRFLFGCSRRVYGVERFLHERDFVRVCDRCKSVCEIQRTVCGCVARTFGKYIVVLFTGGCQVGGCCCQIFDRFQNFCVCEVNAAKYEGLDFFQISLCVIVLF